MKPLAVLIAERDRLSAEIPKAEEDGRRAEAAKRNTQSQINALKQDLAEIERTITVLMDEDA